MTPFAISRDSPWTQTAWSQALDLDEIQFLSDWNGDAVRAFGVAHDFRGMKDVSRCLTPGHVAKRLAPTKRAQASATRPARP